MTIDELSAISIEIIQFIVATVVDFLYLNTRFMNRFKQMFKPIKLSRKRVFFFFLIKLLVYRFKEKNYLRNMFDDLIHRYPTGILTTLFSTVHDIPVGINIPRLTSRFLGK